MNLYSDAYAKNIAANQAQQAHWSVYCEKLKALDLSQFSEKLTVPVLVPVSSRILFRGELIHTNEVTVALGANYMTKCNTKQAQIIQNHRIKVAEEKIKELEIERSYLEGQIEFSKKHVFEDGGKDIIEPFDEEVERKWKKKHRENVRKAKTSNKIETVSDKDLLTKLDQLELQEELEQLASDINEVDLQNETNASLDRKGSVRERAEEENKRLQIEEIEKSRKILELVQEIGQIENETNRELDTADLSTRRGIVEARLNELHSIQMNCNTVGDVVKRLDQLEEQEELEEELERLEDLANTIASHEETASVESSETEEQSSRDMKRSVSFADNSDDECIEINFEHSQTQPDNSHYNSSVGLQKPSDIYDAFPECFAKGKIMMKSILRKNSTDYSDYAVAIKDNATYGNVEDDVMRPARENVSVNLLGDIVEHSDNFESIGDSKNNKKVSKFRQMRMRKLSSE